MYVAVKDLRQGYKLGLNWEGLTVTEVKNLGPLPGNTSGGDLRTPTTTFKAKGLRDGVEYHLEALMFQDSMVWVEDAEPEPKPDYHSAMIKNWREAALYGKDGTGSPSPHTLLRWVNDLMNLADEQQRTIDKLTNHRHRWLAHAGGGKTTPPLKEEDL
jgi:hypothetical protein